MKGIQATTVDTLMTGELASSAVETDVLAFQHFLQGYAGMSLEQEIVPEEALLDEGLEQEETEKIESAETDKGEQAQEETVEATVVQTPTETVITGNQHPQYFHLFPEQQQMLEETSVSERTSEQAEGKIVATTNTSLMTNTLETTNLQAVPKGEAVSLNQDGQVATTSVVNEPTFESVLTTNPTGATESQEGLSNQAATQPITTGIEQAVVEKVEVSPEALAQVVPTATVTIPVEMVPQEGTQKPQELSAAVIEKISQPIVEKVTTMNAPDAQKITVELLPEKLGKVEVSIRVTDQKVQLEFVVENSQTRQLLESITTKLERVLNKQEFPQIATQERVNETTQVATDLENVGDLFDQSAFQQGFQGERQKQHPFGKTAKSKTFSEIAMEKIEKIPGDGSVDLLV